MIDMETKMLSDLLTSALSNFLNPKQRIELTNKVQLPNGEIRRGLFVSGDDERTHLQTEFTGIDGIEKTIESIKKEMEGMNQ